MADLGGVQNGNDQPLNVLSQYHWLEDRILDQYNNNSMSSFVSRNPWFDNQAAEEFKTLEQPLPSSLTNPTLCYRAEDKWSGTLSSWRQIDTH